MIEGNNFDQPLPEIILNGDITQLGTVTATAANTTQDSGDLDDSGGLPAPHTIPGESDTKFTQIRKYGEFMYQYIKVPVTANPTTVTITVPAGTIVNYTYGPQYPSYKPDNISCFQYTGPIVIQNNKGSDGTWIYATAFRAVNGKATSNDQSPLLIANFKVHK
jgi:hypothetical protein